MARTDTTPAWDARTDADQHQPVYFMRVAGLGYDFATDDVKAPTSTKVLNMDVPKGGGVSIELLDGTRTVQEFQIELFDYNGTVTALIATEAPGAPLATLINRRVSLHGGYADLDETDYAQLVGGRITAVRMNDSMTGYVFTVADTIGLMLSKPIMVNAFEIDDPADPGSTLPQPARIAGNIVNVLYAILTGTFSLSGDFPLESFSADVVGVSSAPTGLGIDPGDIDTARLIAERDTWHPDDTTELVFDEPIDDAKDYIETEFFRVFQCFGALSGSGKVGIKFVVPALNTTNLDAVTHLDHIVEVTGWRRAYEDHLNQFTFRGDYDGEPAGTGQFAKTFDVGAPEDTDDQTATGEIREVVVESQWLRTDRDGDLIAMEMAGRLRAIYMPAPVNMTLKVTFRKRKLEEGDIILVTDHNIPDVLTGTMGVTQKPMLVKSIAPDFERGLMDVEVMDNSYRRFGVISPDAQANYEAASPTEQATYLFITDNAGVMADSSPGYRWI